MASVGNDPGCRCGVLCTVVLSMVALGGSLGCRRVPANLTPGGWTSAGVPLSQLQAPLRPVARDGPVVRGQTPPGEVSSRPASQGGVPEVQVVEVHVVGARQTPVAEVLRHIHTRAGRPFDPELIEDDVRRLYKTRKFVEVNPRYQEVPRGRIVTFEVLERPILSYVKYVGNRKISKKKLEKESGIKAGDALDPFAVEEGRRRLEEYYRSKGYARAQVTILEGSNPSDQGAIYLFNEGPKQRIGWTNFVGNTIATDAKLRTKIQSKPGIFWLFKGELNRKQVDEDVVRLTEYYRGLGFFRAEVSRLPVDPTKTWQLMTFVVNEGPRYCVRNVSFNGNSRFGDEELAERLELNTGRFFNRTEMQSDLAAIRDTYGAIGHIFADVNADIRFFEEPGQLDLVYAIQEGKPYRVGEVKVEILGENPHTRITTVLNRLSLSPGDLIDIREIRASERRLKASGLFEVDPMQGVSPQIVVRPPELEDAETSIARQPEERPRVRGQSPDPRPHTALRPPNAPNGPSGDGVLDLCVRGRWISDPQPVRSGEEDGLDASQPQPGSGSPDIVRGQYSADAGQSVPPLRRPQPRPEARPSTPYGGYLPPTETYPQSTYPQSTYPTTPGGSAPYEQSPPVTGPTLDDGSVLLGNPPDEDPPLYLPVIPRVQETRTGRLMFSAGVNSDAGLLGSVIVDEQNFDWTRFPTSWEDIRNGTAWRGAGQRFRLEAVPGTQVQKYTANFQEPYLFDTAVSLGLSGYYYNRWYREWDEERLGGRVGVGYQFTHDLSGTLAFRGARIQIFDPIVPTPAELTEVLGENALYGFRAQLTHDTRDNSFLATEGHLFEAGVEQVIGSFDYIRGDIDFRKYFMLRQHPDGSGRHVLSLNGRAAVSSDNTPIYEHYYAGGFSTLRGFDFRGASPRDPATGVLVGGHFSLLASVEYLFPITADDNLRAVVFCDTGAVQPSIDDWTDKYRVAPGFGLRIVVPAMGPAPIALDFAFPVSKEPGDEKEVFSFFVGFLR